MQAGPEFPHPVFVGGVGRSGTHVMARLIAASQRYARIRTEARFHAWEGGLPDLCAGRTTLEEFIARMRGHWWQRGANQRQGIHRILDAEPFERALAEFEAGFPADPIGASRGLVSALLDPTAEREGRLAWVEATGATIDNAPFLRELFPRARFVNMVRDGRAVVAATLKKVNLTDEPSRALRRWEDAVRAADRTLRELPEGTVLTVVLEELTAHDREGTFARLVDFLELADPGPMRDYFEREISAERAHVGAWRQRMAPADARWVDRRYRRLLRRMQGQGITCTPSIP